MIKLIRQLTLDYISRYDSMCYICIIVSIYDKIFHNRNKLLQNKQYDNTLCALLNQQQL